MNTKAPVCYEFVAFSPPPVAALGTDWPHTAGAALQRDNCSILHIAAARWLVIDPTTAIVEQLNNVATSGTGSLTNISGKWRKVALPDSGAETLLNAGAAINVFLRERGCAAFQLFECPVVLMRGKFGLSLWVQSSYAPGLKVLLEIQRGNVD